MKSAAAVISELEALRRELGAAARRRKIELLAELVEHEIAEPRVLKRLHEVACFLRAYADDRAVFEAAGDVLRSYPDRIDALAKRARAKLDDSGIAGTSVVHEFSFDIVRWMTTQFHGAADIAWDRFDEPERLDGLLSLLLVQAEETLWEEGTVGTEEWVRRARGSSAHTDLQWLLQQLPTGSKARARSALLYDEAEVPVRWSLGASEGSRTLCEVSFLAKPASRTEWRRTPSLVGRTVARTLPGLRRLPAAKAREVISVARAALAARQREVYAMTYGNPDEVYLAPLGAGTHVAIIGVQPAYRLNLEANYGYVILSCGRPIGYGGISPLFRQGNTGINIRRLGGFVPGMAEGHWRGHPRDYPVRVRSQVRPAQEHGD